MQVADYQLGNVLGEGSFGKVYKAVNVKTNREVAVKQMSKKLIDTEPYLVNALKVEINVMKSLKGDHVVRLLDEIET